jgi:hypothetical protein
MLLSHIFVLYGLFGCINTKSKNLKYTIKWFLKIKQIIN